MAAKTATPPFRSRRLPVISWTRWMSSRRRDVVVVACFGDSITDGTASTLNGDDRWPDVLSRRLHEKFGDTRLRAQRRHRRQPRRVSRPHIQPRRRCRGARPPSNGSIAMSRALSGFSAVIWLEGINDLAGGAKADAIIAGMREIVTRSRARGVRIFGATSCRVSGARRAWHAGSRRRTSGDKRVHPHRRSLRWCRRLRPGDTRSADGGAARGVPAQQHDRRTW